MDDEISIPGTRGRCGYKVSGIITGDIAEQRDENLCRVSESRSCAYVNRDTAEFIGIESGAVSQGKEFAPTANGIFGIKEAVLGSASMGAGLLGCNERKCDR